MTRSKKFRETFWAWANTIDIWLLDLKGLKIPKIAPFWHNWVNYSRVSNNREVMIIYFGIFSNILIKIRSDLLCNTQKILCNTLHVYSNTTIIQDSRVHDNWVKILHFLNQYHISGPVPFFLTLFKLYWETK